MTKDEIRALGEKVAKGQASEEERVEFLKHFNDMLERLTNTIEEAIAK